jgi:uncharacterized membrane protein
MTLAEILPILGMVGVTAGAVAIRVAQQLNVARGYFIRAFFTSYLFTAFDGVAIGIYAKTAFDGNWLNLIFMGTGSAIGGLLTMYFYHRKGK